MNQSGIVKVLIVDDSAIVRKILSEELSKDDQIKVVGTAPDPFIARDKILNLEPDVVILDIEMPKMDGLTFLKKIMKYNPLPVIIVSSISKSGSENALKALSYGAVDVFGKPGGPYSVGDLKSELVNKVKSIGKSSFKYRYNENLNEKKYTPISASKLSQKTKKIIAIGASTGGTEAIKDVIYRLPQNIPGIIIVQHMPEYFIKPYADRLNSDCNLNVKVAQHNDKITEGTVYVAPFGSHTIVKKNANDYFIELKDGPFVHHQKPSASVLFKSLAMSAGSEAIGVILTGMGKDGSTGLLEMKEAGSYNIAQDEESCVIFGMPKEAINNGSIHKIAPLNTIAEEIVNILSINILT